MPGGEENINPRFVEIESRLIEDRVELTARGQIMSLGLYIILNYIDFDAVRPVTLCLSIYPSLLFFINNVFIRIFYL